MKMEARNNPELMQMAELIRENEAMLVALQTADP